MKKEPQRQYVIGFGDSLRQYGPFKTGADAVKWAEKNLDTSHHWVIKPLSIPF